MWDILLAVAVLGIVAQLCAIFYLKGRTDGLDYATRLMRDGVEVVVNEQVETINEELRNSVRAHEELWAEEQNRRRIEPVDDLRW